jgi:hypothetical protein
MASKKSTKKSGLNRKMDPVTESVALGSAFSVLFFVLLKTMLLAIPLGLALAFAHHYGRNHEKKK